MMGNRRAALLVSLMAASLGDLRGLLSVGRSGWNMAEALVLKRVGLKACK